MCPAHSSASLFSLTFTEFLLWLHADPESGLGAEDTRMVKSVPIFPVTEGLVDFWADFLLINSSVLQRVTYFLQGAPFLMGSYWKQNALCGCFMFF